MEGCAMGQKAKFAKGIIWVLNRDLALIFIVTVGDVEYTKVKGWNYLE